MFDYQWLNRESSKDHKDRLSCDHDLPFKLQWCESLINLHVTDNWITISEFNDFFNDRLHFRSAALFTHIKSPINISFHKSWHCNAFLISMLNLTKDFHCLERWFNRSDKKFVRQRASQHERRQIKCIWIGNGFLFGLFFFPLEPLLNS